MKKRDKQREQREVIHALSMILQIGLAMLTCMGISLAIGYYLDQLLGTKIWIIIMLVIGILASMRSLLVLTGQFGKGNPTDKSAEQEEVHERSKKDTP
ncbi:MAG: AtpZ/AtpI family protein [Eubacterium sp.]